MRYDTNSLELPNLSQSYYLVFCAINTSYRTQMQYVVVYCLRYLLRNGCHFSILIYQLFLNQYRKLWWRNRWISYISMTMPSLWCLYSCMSFVICSHWNIVMCDHSHCTLGYVCLSNSDTCIIWIFIVLGIFVLPILKPTLSSHLKVKVNIWLFFTSICLGNYSHVFWHWSVEVQFKVISGNSNYGLFKWASPVILASSSKACL